MKLIEIKDMHGHTVFFNPNNVLYIQDKSTFSETMSLIDMTDASLYVPYQARKVYEMIRKETEPNYCSYEKMRELIDAERKYKEQLAGNRGPGD